MRIGVSLLNFRPGKMGGIETYFLEIVKWLPICAGPKCEIVFICDRDVLEGLDLGDRALVVDCSSRCLSIARILEAFTPYRCGWVERLIRDAEIDAMFYPHQAMFPLRCPVPSIITVHDIQHMYHPRNFPLFDRAFRKTIWERSLYESDHIIAISQATSKSVQHKFGIQASKISVVHHGIHLLDASSIKPMQQPACGSYYYYPAASFPHKGHMQLIESCGKLKAKGLLEGKRIVFSGLKTGYWDKIKRRISELELDEDVVHFGFIDYEAVLSLYKGAEAVLFPSEFEGFGIPVLEAVQLGKKIVCSRLEVFSEIGVPDSARIDFKDEKALFSALVDATGATKLTRVPLTWKESIQQTLAVVSRCVAG